MPKGRVASRVVKKISEMSKYGKRPKGRKTRFKPPPKKDPYKKKIYGP